MESVNLSLLSKPVVKFDRPESVGKCLDLQPNVIKECKANNESF